MLSAALRHLDADSLSRACKRVVLVQVNVDDLLRMALHQVMTRLSNMVCVVEAVAHVHILAEVEELAVKAFASHADGILEVRPCVTRRDVSPRDEMEVTKGLSTRA